MKGKYAFAISLAAVVSAAGGALAAGLQQPDTPPPGPGLTMINEKCGFCHTTAQVFVTRRSPADWPGVVQQMIDRGAELTAEEQSTITSYLAANWSTGPAPAAGAQVPPGVNAAVTAPTGAAAAPAATPTPAASPAPAKR